MALDEKGPTWMNEGNDESHSLLFGSGTPSLQDEESAEPASKDHFGKTDDYGSTTPNGDEEDGGKTDISNVTEASEGGSILEGPRRNWILQGFHFIEGFGVLSCIALMATQIIPLFFIPMEEFNAGSLVLKFYISIFCVVFILVEYDAPIGFLKESKVLQNYFSRGFVYSFLGVSALEEAYSERVHDTVGHQLDEFHVSWLGVFMQLAAWMIFGVGVLYMLFSLCCLKTLRDNLKENDLRKWREFREAKRVMKKYQKR